MRCRGWLKSASQARGAGALRRVVDRLGQRSDDFGFDYEVPPAQVGAEIVSPRRFGFWPIVVRYYPGVLSSP